ncbi:MAG: hypothetical protein LWX83_11395 [Anaerolineae bacterium]|nr:hypothetical protein [Anaerolineae bacterium]
MLCFGAGIFLFNNPPAAHQLPQPAAGWDYDQISWVSPSISNEDELIAVYARLNEKKLEIRLDYLDLKKVNNLSISFFSAAQTELFNITCQTAEETCRGSQYRSGKQTLFFTPFFVQSSDAVIFQINDPDLIRQSHQLYIHVMEGGQTIPTRPEIALFSNRNTPQVNLILAFWNTLPASSPVQLMRRWDGAHTGPFGQRHGLNQLIHNVSDYQVPVFLLDLKQSPSLAGLGYMHKSDGLKMTPLLLPDVYTLNRRDLITSGLKNMVEHWGIPSSPAAFVYSTDYLQDYSYPLTFQITDSPNVEISSINNGRLVSLPGDPSQINDELDRFGFSPAGKSKLINALSDKNNRLLWLGGNLSASAWGDSMAAPKGMDYIKQHPWIKPLDVYQAAQLTPDLPGINLSKTEVTIDCNAPLMEINDPGSAYRALHCAAPNPMTTLAWQEYIRLTTTPATEAEKALYSHYYVNIRRLLIASDWVNTPRALHKMINLPDGEDFVLSNAQHLLIFNTIGGRLTLAVSRTPAGIRQWIAPTSQFALGLSDPETWRNAGELSDPDVITGAFVDAGFEKEKYRFEEINNGLRLSLPEAGIYKSFTLSGENLIVEYSSRVDLQSTLLFSYDPYQYLLNGMQPELSAPDFSPTDIIPIRFQAGVEMNQPLSWYFDSYADMQTSEDPDKDYPTGSYTAFPVGLGNLSIHKNTKAIINFELSELK